MQFILVASGRVQALRLSLRYSDVFRYRSYLKYGFYSILYLLSLLELDLSPFLGQFSLVDFIVIDVLQVDSTLHDDRVNEFTAAEDLRG